jgi:hypothetical protein
MTPATRRSRKRRAPACAACRPSWSIEHQAAQTGLPSTVLPTALRRRPHRRGVLARPVSGIRPAAARIATPIGDAMMVAIGAFPLVHGLAG